MRQNDAQRRLNQSPPADLRARCVATIPQEARDNAHRSLVFKRRTKQKLVFAGGLLAVVLIGSAFWTTRPLHNAGDHLSGSAAFAQTVKAMQDVGYVHISARRLNTNDEDGSSNSQWYHADGWFDADQGQYWTAGHKPDAQVTSSEGGAPGSTRTLSKLQLPNGTVYTRSGSTLTISNNPRKWQLVKRTLPLSLLGNAALVAAENSRSSDGESASVPKLQSARTIQWQGQPTRLLQFEVAPSQSALGTRTNLYVNVKTSRVIEMREFAVKEGSPDRMVVQARANYLRPDAILFSTGNIYAGTANVRMNERPVRVESGSTSNNSTSAPTHRVGVDVPLFMAPIPADLDVAPRQIVLQRVTAPSGQKGQVNRIFIAPLTDTATIAPSHAPNSSSAQGFSIDVTTDGGLLVQVPFTLKGDPRIDMFVQKGQLTDAQVKALKSKVARANAGNAKIFILRRNIKGNAPLTKEQTKIIDQLRKQVLEGTFPSTSSSRVRIKVPPK